MSTERTPEERAEADEHRAAVQAVIDEARRNLASWVLADELDESPQVCEEWVNRLWNHLRAELDGESRLLAILMLLEPDANAVADQLRLSLETS